MMNFFRSPKKRRSTRVAELLNLDAMAALFEDRVAKSTHGILNEVKLRKADRRARKTITSSLEEIVLDIVTREKPDLILEIGAHGAEFSKLAKTASPASRCIAIEGNPHVHALHIDAATAANIEYVNACISEKRMEIEFHVPVYKDTSKASMGSMLRFQEHLQNADARHEVVKSPALPLDDLLANERNRSKLIWIDVEGAVGPVLAGAKKSLSNCMALYIEVETEVRWEGQTVLAADVYDLLAPHGFIPLLRDVQRKRWQHNVLYVHESIASKRYIGKSARRHLRSLGEGT